MAIDPITGDTIPDTGGIGTGTGDVGGTPAPWDFWSSLAGLFNLTDPTFAGQLQGWASDPNMKWRQPRYAQQMLTFANMLNGLGQEDMAQELALQAVGMGFQQPQWNLSSIFAPLGKQWFGSGYGGQGGQSGGSNPFAGLFGG